MPQTTEHPTNAPLSPGTVTVDVLVDGYAQLGPLSYEMPQGWEWSVGDAVSVPFGSRGKSGVIVGPGQRNDIVLKVVESTHGSRIDERDLEVAKALSTEQLATPWALLGRSAPSKAKGAEPLDAGPVLLKAPSPIEPSKNTASRFVLRPAHLHPAVLAVAHAVELSKNGQVLVICPTAELVKTILGKFESGAARLDAKADRGAWRGFRAGSVSIGIGTSAAMLYSAKNLAGIVLVEADHIGHTSQRQPYVSSLACSIARATAHEATLIASGVIAPPRLLKKLRVTTLQNMEYPRVEHISKPRSSRPLTPVVQSRISVSARAGKKVVVVAQSELTRVCNLCNTTSKGSVCGRCQNDVFKTIGWDKERLAPLLPHSVEVLTPAELALHTGADLIVTFSAHVPGTRATHTPVWDTLAPLAHACSALAPNGTLIVVAPEQFNHLFHHVSPDSAVSLSRATWEESKGAKLPPHAHLVSIEVDGPSRPDTKSLRQRVFGPHKTASGWELLVSVPLKDTQSLRPFVDALRARRKTRVRVL